MTAPTIIEQNVVDLVDLAADINAKAREATLRNRLFIRHHKD